MPENDIDIGDDQFIFCTCCHFFAYLISLKEFMQPTFQNHARFVPLFRILLIAWLGIAIIETPVRAQDISDLPLEELMNLKVTSASKNPSLLLTTPAAIHVITQEDIRRSGANSIPALLKMVPGMHVARLDSNRWGISARGFNGQFANKLLVMIDGRSLYTPIFSGVYWDVQDLVLSEIDRIEVIRGPGASLWGANAVNGIINIISKPAEETLGTKVTAWVGTEERAGLSAMQGAKIGPNSYFRFTAKGFVRDESHLNGTDAGDDMTMGRAGFRWDYTGSHYTGKTTGSFYQGREGANYDQVSHEGDFHHLFNDDTDMVGGHLLTNWSRQLSSISSLSFQLSFDYSSRKEALYDEDLQVLDLEFQHNYEPSPGHKLTWGGNLRTYFDDLTAHSNVFIDPASDRYSLFSLFFQDEYPLRKNLILTLGSKLEHTDFDGWEIQPSGRLLWKVSETMSVWGAISRAARTPSRLESDGEIVVALYPPGHALNPTPNANIPVPLPIVVTFRGSDEFESEELIAHELGMRTLVSENASIDISVFWNRYSNLRTGSNLSPNIVFDGALPVAIDQVSLANNNLEGDTYGFEASMEYQATESWKLIGAYSYMEMDFNFGGQLEEFLNSFYARHQASIQSRLNLPHNVESDIWLTYTDEIQVQNQPEIWDLTIRIGWQPTSKLGLELVGQNLLSDHKKQFSSELINIVSSEVERAVFLRLTYQL